MNLLFTCITNWGLMASVCIRLIILCIFVCNLVSYKINTRNIFVMMVLFIKMVSDIQRSDMKSSDRSLSSEHFSRSLPWGMFRTQRSKGGTPLCNRRDMGTSIAWPNTKLISPEVNSALDQTSWGGQKLTRPKSLTLNSTTRWPPVSIVLECRQFYIHTYLPSTTSWLCRDVLDQTRRGIKSIKLC